MKNITPRTWYLATQDDETYVLHTKKYLDQGWDSVYKLRVPFSTWDDYSEKKLAEEIIDKLGDNQRSGSVQVFVGNKLVSVQYEPYEINKI